MKKIVLYGVLLTTLFASVACGSTASSSSPSTGNTSSEKNENTSSSLGTTSSSSVTSSNPGDSSSSSSIPTPIVDEETTVTETFNIMSFNIRNENTSDTGATNWSQRGSHLIEYVLTSGMDVICFQEVKYTQYVDMYVGLKSKYDVLYFPREVSANPEGLMIAYDNTFELIEKDLFWLSTTPDKVGKGFDTQYPRICGNVLLRSNEGTMIDVYDVHLGLGNDTIRKNELETVLNRRKNNPYPMMVMGDFNAHRDDKGTEANTGECIGYISETFKDCQLVAPETDMVATFNGWSEPTSVMIDYIFVSEEITPNKFDVNQERWGDNNFYSDHFAVDAELTVTYDKKTIENVKSIDVEGDLEVIADEGSNTLNANVVATLEDGTTVPLSQDYYTYDLPDTLYSGKDYDVTISLNGYKNVSVTKEAAVRARHQAELYQEIKGGSANTETHQLLVDDKFVEDKLYTFVGNFDKTVAAGKESSVTLNVISETTSLNDLVLSAGNGNCQGTKGAYYMGELQLNKILDITVNGTPVTISDEVRYEKSITSSDYALLYQISEYKVIKDVMLNKGENVVKFQFKTHPDGIKNCWGRTPSSLNIDYVDFITKEINISNNEVIKSIEVTSSKFTFGMMLNQIEVMAHLENGTSRKLAPFEYEVEVVGNSEADSFYYGTYDIKVTLLENPSITTTKSVSIIDYYCKATLADLYIENDRVIYELRFMTRGYEVESYEFFWTAAEHIYKYTATIEDEVGIFKFDATDLTTHSTTKRAICPHLRLTDLNGSTSMYVNGKNQNGDILSTDGSLVYENNKTVTLGGKKYYIQAYYDMPTLYIE